ncbi:unnamed protein product [Spirodela intermedia]|uniref:Uncharacterized protein n=1 Tax=Spirodela intermedia TaxID=51605 RepID=A0ABN7E9L8_SPIIN|nr:unnamed protein product [Spirodela intermedia]
MDKNSAPICSTRGGQLIGL